MISMIMNIKLMIGDRKRNWVKNNEIKKKL